MDILIFKQCSVTWNCLLITTNVEEAGIVLENTTQEAPCL